MANPTDKKPTVGRIVMYIPTVKTPEANNHVEVVPAVVVRTWEDTSYVNDEINIRVFCDGPATTWQTSIPHSSSKEPGTWHWPEIK